VVERVTAQDHVGAGQQVTGDVSDSELDVWAPIQFLISADDRRDDVHAGIVDSREIDLAHPVEVSARRVEE
jgi:hypothetical protein